MFTKYTLVASLAVASMIATSSDVFAGRRPGTRYSRPIFNSNRSCCVVVTPCATVETATAAAPGTYRSFSYDPATPAPVYRAPAAAPSRMPTYMLPKMDPRKHSGGW